jgi:hypothetical protein
LIALLSLSLVGCGQAVVDGVCAEGYAQSERGCQRPAPAVSADAGQHSSLDADIAESSSDTAVDDAAPADTAVADSCPPPPFNTAEACGACGVVCTGETPKCKVNDDGIFGCAPACELPQTFCSGVCVDLAVDPYNCGACGNVCPTGLCNGGVCRGTAPGHVVVVGHDFTGASPAFSVSRVLANAVFLAHRNPVRVVAFERWADAASVASAKTILDEASRVSGRTYTKTVAATPTELRDRLRIDSFDVALVMDQPGAPLGALGSIGGELRASLDSFARVGGVVVVLDGGSGISEMPSFLTSSSMLAVSSHENATGKPIEVIAAADAIAIGVFTPYSAPTRTVTFELAEPLSTTIVPVVAEPVSAKPVVLHKVVFK